jgi:acyl carrier protein
MASVEDRLKKVMAGVFFLEPAEVSRSASRETIANWDSIHAITLLLSVEEEFGVSFTDQETMKFSNFESILGLLGEKGVC